MSKALKIIDNILIILAVAIAVALLLPPIMGITTTIIDSTGIRSNLPVGSVTYSRKATAEDLKPGDLVLVESKNEAYEYEVVNVDDAMKTMTVKNAFDKEAEEKTEKVNAHVSRVSFTIPYIGYAVIAMQSIEGMIVIGLIVLFIIVLYILSEVWKKKPEDEEEEREEKPKKRREASRASSANAPERGTSSPAQASANAAERGTSSPAQTSANAANSGAFAAAQPVANAVGKSVGTAAAAAAVAAVGTAAVAGAAAAALAKTADSEKEAQPAPATEETEGSGELSEEEFQRILSMAALSSTDAAGEYDWESLQVGSETSGSADAQKGDTKDVRAEHPDSEALSFTTEAAAEPSALTGAEAVQGAAGEEAAEFAAENGTETAGAALGAAAESGVETKGATAESAAESDVGTVGASAGVAAEFAVEAGAKTVGAAAGIAAAAAGTAAGIALGAAFADKSKKDGGKEKAASSEESAEGEVPSGKTKEIVAKGKAEESSAKEAAAAEGKTKELPSGKGAGRKNTPPRRKSLDEMLDYAKKGGGDPEFRKDDISGLDVVDYSSFL